jgi:hypothetical protein
MKSAIWTLAAEADVQLLYERLECNELSMGDRFYSEVLSTVKLLESLPELGPVVYGDRIRRVLVFNRNYGLFYIVEPRGGHYPCIARFATRSSTNQKAYCADGPRRLARIPEFWFNPAIPETLLPPGSASPRGCVTSP